MLYRLLHTEGVRENKIIAIEIKYSRCAFIVMSQAVNTAAVTVVDSKFHSMVDVFPNIRQV
jgi:hypothetical protein